MLLNSNSTMDKVINERLKLSNIALVWLKRPMYI